MKLTLSILTTLAAVAMAAPTVSSPDLSGVEQVCPGGY